MAQYELSFQDYFRIFRKRWLIIALAVFVAGMFCFLYQKYQEPIYEASATIQVVQRNTLAGLLSETLLRQGDVLQTSLDIIKSNAVLEVVADQCELVKPNDPPEVKKQKLRALQSWIFPTRKQQTELVDIVVRGNDQLKVVAIANATARAYQQYDEAREKSEAQAVRVFVEEQLRSAQESLDLVEAEMVEQQQQQYGTRIDNNTEMVVKSLAQVETDYLSAKQQRQEREITLAKMQELQRRGAFQNLGSSFTEINDPMVIDLKRKLSAQQNQLTELAEEYTDAHPAIIELKEQIATTQAQLRQEVARQIQGRENALQTEIDILRTKENVLGERMGRFNSQLSVLPEQQRNQASIQRRVTVYSDIVSMLTRELEQKRIAEAGQVSGITIIQSAENGRLIYPRGNTTLLAGALIGLILGIAFAFVVESLDTSIATIEDVEKYTGKVVIGVIPHIDIEGEVKRKRRMTFRVQREKTSITDLKRRLDDMERDIAPDGGEPRLDARLITFYDPKSPISEAYRTLRTNILYLDQAKHSKVFVVTSSGPQEGKTTTISNLGITMAQMGAKTLLIGCNLRRPQLYKIFGVPKRNGVVDIIKGNVPWQDTVKPTGIDNLSIITCGGIPPNPSELLSSNEMTTLLRDVRAHFDYVLIDSPPLLPVTDAAIIGSKADCTILVYFIGKAAREALLRAKTMLENVHANVLGIVLNDLASKAELGRGSYYYYYYHYRYYGNEKREKPKQAPV
ncbi:MAG TPA: polysaccharide biosynthesis tyrosine autokinase [bacterium]|nr:polysaccharide biosynthesis tyrosine autokinase [bacterium]